jgi:hypothetical protein
VFEMTFPASRIFAGPIVAHRAPVQDALDAATKKAASKKIADPEGVSFCVFKTGLGAWG